MAASTMTQPFVSEGLHLKTLRREFEKNRGGRSLKQDSLVSTASTSSATQDDLARILEPSQKKLTTVESQRVLSVLDECIKKLQTVSVLPNVMRDLPRYSVSLGSDVVGLLEEHARLRGEYHDALREEGERVDSVENLATSTSQLSLADSQLSSPSQSALTSKPRKLDPLSDTDRSCSRSADELRSLLRHSARSLVRAFLNSPPAMTAIKGLECTSPCVTACQAELQALRTVVLERLLTTQQEKDNQEDKISSLAERLQQTMSAVCQLEKELSTAESVREEEKSKRTMQLEKLMSQKKAVKKLSEEANSRVRADTGKQMESNKQGHEAKWTQLDEEHGALSKQCATVVAANREKELQLRKVSYVHSWLCMMVSFMCVCVVLNYWQ